MQLDSDDENDPSNDPNSVPGARTSGDAELDPNALEDTDVDMDAGEEEDPDRQGGAHVRGAAAPTAAAASGPKMADDYKAWLAARKAAWRAHRLANRQRRAAGGAGAGPHSEADAGGGLGALGQGMQRQMAAMMHATWQVLQVCFVPRNALPRSVLRPAHAPPHLSSRRWRPRRSRASSTSGRS